MVIDLQEKFAPVIHDWESVLKRSVRLIRFFHLLRAPILVSEQYPKGLGATVQPVFEALKETQPTISSKMAFSACAVSELKQKMRQTRRKQWVVCGIEGHVCVQQTVLDLLDQGMEVFVARDAVGSRHTPDRDAAFARMAHSGAVVSTSESLIFESLRDATHPLFKQAAALVR